MVEIGLSNVKYVLSVKFDEVVKAESEIRQLLFRQIVTANAESYSEVLKREGTRMVHASVTAG